MQPGAFVTIFTNRIETDNLGSWVYCLWLMVFKATFNNSSVLSWRSVLLVEGTGLPGENQQPVANH